jgi:hypothetical protein
MRKALAAVHDPMAHGMNVCHALNVMDAGISRAGPANNQLYGRARIPERSSRTPRLLPFGMQRHDGFAADSLDRAARQPTVIAALD